MSAILTAALAYAGRGLAVFPACAAVKKSHKCAEHSNGARWGASSDSAEIRRDFTRWPNARIGIPTGAGNRIVVIEADTVAGHGVDGAASLAQLEADHGALPDTLTACSPSGSLHRYFRHPGAVVKIRTTASELGRGIDVRGDGGMVIAPPSINLDGRAYRWINKLPIAVMPAWLVELTRDRPRTISQRAVAAIARPILTDGSSTRYGAVALESEITELECAAPRTRQAALNRCAFKLFQLVPHELDEALVTQRLYRATEINGARDPAWKIKDTIERAKLDGLANPRFRGPR
jgi:hypothetical protein